MEKIVPPGGIHYLIDFYGVSPDKLTNAQDMASHMIKAAILAGANVLSDHFHHFGEGCGVTGVLILSESHMSIHTWPETGYASIDIYMCGDSSPDKCIPILEKYFNPVDSKINRIERN